MIIQKEGGSEMTEELIESPVSIFRIAADKGFEPAFIEKMMELQERHEANEAKKAYHEAMTNFKASPPEIEKDKTVSYDVGNKTTTYTHASLANVTEKINKALSEHGLSASWTISQVEGITVTCTITHKLGHGESTSLTALPDASGGKNSIQAIGSSVTYLERYTLLALTGLSTYDMDDDGGESTVCIDKKQVAEIEKKIKEVKADKGKFLGYLKVKSVEEIPLASFDTAMTALASKGSV